MDFNEYQRATRQTAVYPDAGLGTGLALAYLGLGLGESGEVQGKVKKIIRDDEGHVTSDKRNAILEELGDVIWYVARMADELDARFEDVARLNLTKLNDRRQRGVIGGSGDNC